MSVRKLDRMHQTFDQFKGAQKDGSRDHISMHLADLAPTVLDAPHNEAKANENCRKTL